MRQSSSFWFEKQEALDSSGFSLQNKKQGSVLELFHCSDFRIQSPRLKGQSLMYNIINSTTIVQAIWRAQANIVRKLGIIPCYCGISTKCSEILASSCLCPPQSTNIDRLNWIPHSGSERVLPGSGMWQNTLRDSGKRSRSTPTWLLPGKPVSPKFGHGCGLRKKMIFRIAIN